MERRGTGNDRKIYEILRFSFLRRADEGVLSDAGPNAAPLLSGASMSRRFRARAFVWRRQQCNAVCNAVYDSVLRNCGAAAVRLRRPVATQK